MWTVREGEKALKEAIASNSGLFNLRHFKPTLEHDEIPSIVAAYFIREPHVPISLDLSGHRLTMLPDTVAKLSNLTVLALDGNLIRHLPSWVGDLTSLTELSVADNLLLTLPHELAKLEHSLLTLNLTSNQLDEVPPCIPELVNLRFLLLDNNPLKSLPESLARLKWLTALGAACTLLEEVPHWLVHEMEATAAAWQQDNAAALAAAPLPESPMGDDDVARAEATKSAAQAERNGEGKLGAAAGGGPEASAEEDEGAGAVPPQLQLRSAIDAAAAHTRAEGEKEMEHGQPQAGEDGEARAEQPPPSPPPSPKTDEPPPKQTADQILASLGITAQATGEGGRGGVNAAADYDADSRDSWDDAAERVLEAQAMEMEEAKKEPSPVGVPAHAMEADKAAAVESVAAEAAVAAHLAELRRRQDEGEGLRAEELEELRQGEAAVVSGADADEASRLQTTVRRGLSRLAGVGRMRSRSPLKAAAGTPEPAPAPESVAGSTAARAIARAKTEKQITAVGAAAAGAATSDEPLSPPPPPDHIQLTQLDLRGTRIAQANLPHTIGHLSWEDRGGRVLTAHGSESRRWESDSRECDAFMQTVVETRVGDVGRRAFQPPRYYSRVAAKRRGDDGGKDPIEKNNNGDDDDDDEDDDAFAPPAEPHYSTQVCESYATPLEAHYEIFAEGVYERGASGRRWETDAETESFMARMARKAGDSGPPPFVPEGGMGMEPSSKGTSRRWATIRGSVGAFTVLRGRITSKQQQDEL
jgi:hypothetical protein